MARVGFRVRVREGVRVRVGVRARIRVGVRVRARIRVRVRVRVEGSNQDCSLLREKPCIIESSHIYLCFTFSYVCVFGYLMCLTFNTNCLTLITFVSHLVLEHLRIVT